MNIKKTLILLVIPPPTPGPSPVHHCYQFDVYLSGSFCTCISMLVCTHSDYPIDLTFS